MSTTGEATQRSSPEELGGSTGSTYTRTSCDLCKRMKIKCERQGESCVHCIARGVKCDMTLVRRKKQVKRGNVLLDVESRIKRLESVLTASGLDAQFGHEDSAAEKPEVRADLTDRLSNLLVDEEDGSSHFIGSSSGFSLFSPQGLQWISERTGSDELSQHINSFTKIKDGSFPGGQAELWHTMSAHEREPLPPKGITDRFVQCFFDTFNTVFPLYDRATFYKYYGLQYSGKPPESVAWYASLNVVIAMGCMIWHSHFAEKSGKPCITQSTLADGTGWRYFRNACSCFVDLMFRDNSLMAVQAIVGMAFVQQTTFDPKPLHLLTATAGRLAYGIGLHRKLDEFGLSQSEIDQRRKVFWIVYILDKAISMRVGHPSVMMDDDIGVDLPEEDKIVDRPDGTKTFYIFRSQAQLALLESRIYTELYSLRSRSRSTLERLKSVSQLDKELQEWRAAIPVEIRPDMEIKCSQEQFVPVIMMHFAYLNCLTTVHRVSIHHGSWTSDRSRQGGSFHDQQLNPRVYASQSICLTAARSSIQLLQLVDLKSKAPRDNFIWMAMFYPLSGFLTLFANIIQNPQDSYVASDLKLMDYITTLLSPEVEVSPFAASAAVKLFKELGNVATKFVEKTYSANMKKTKRAHERQDSEQDVPQSVADNSEAIDASLPGNINSEISDSMMFSTNPLCSSTAPVADLSSMTTFDPLSQPNIDGQQPLQPYSNSFVADLAPSMANPSSLSFSGARYPTLMSDPLIFSEFFEWDLANLRNSDYTQGSSDF